jgi:2-polyprenyl-3-methyl-5-hydroxy-6-metoxy-1,4-benzoquinol methylase
MQDTGKLIEKKQNIRKPAKQFSLLLNKINIDKLSIEPYAASYLQHLLINKEYYIDIYVSVLEKAFLQTNKKPADITFVDFGAGNGLLGMFASYLGVGTVYVVDADKSFVAAAKITAQVLQIPIDKFIAGTEEMLFSEKYPQKPDIIAGTDVIEHIYDLDLFFFRLQKLNKHVVTIFTTASNPCNRKIVKQLESMQRKDELEGGMSGDHILFGNSHLPFREIRKQIIHSYSSVLNNDEVDKLAAVTRGMSKPDIEESVIIYLSSGKMPVEISHPTNTCHPDTGSWSERILSISEYERVFHHNGFSLEITNGFYNKYSPLLKRIIVLFVNTFIKLFPGAGIKIAPFIVLTGKKQETT